jgi:hypothetical protein
VAGFQIGRKDAALVDFGQIIAGCFVFNPEMFGGNYQNMVGLICLVDFQNKFAGQLFEVRAVYGDTTEALFENLVM